MRINPSMPPLPPVDNHSKNQEDPWDLDLEVKENTNANESVTGGYTAAGVSCANCTYYSCGNCGTQRACGNSNNCQTTQYC
jgi:hypothetical protein